MEVTTTMSPPAAARSSRSIALVTRSVPSTLSSYIQRHPSTSPSSTLSRPRAPPALLTTPSRPPVELRCSASAATSSSEVMSRGMPPHCCAPGRGLPASPAPSSCHHPISLVGKTTDGLFADACGGSGDEDAAISSSGSHRALLRVGSATIMHASGLQGESGSRQGHHLMTALPRAASFESTSNLIRK